MAIVDHSAKYAVEKLLEVLKLVRSSAAILGACSGINPGFPLSIVLRVSQVVQGGSVDSYKIRYQQKPGSCRGTTLCRVIVGFSRSARDYSV
jgi:hypothetical protein